LHRGRTFKKVKGNTQIAIHKLQTFLQTRGRSGILADLKGGYGGGKVGGSGFSLSNAKDVNGTAVS